MDDGELLRRVAGKDLAAFRTFVDLYQNRVLGLCSRLLNHPQNAEDAAQDVFFQVYRSAPSFRHDCRVSSWIYRIALNRCRNFNRDNKRHLPDAALQRRFNNGDLGREAAAAQDGDDPASDLSLSETRAIIRKAVAALPDRQRTMLVLSKFEGRSYQEIAEIMDVSLPSVESGLHRAKRNLQKNLASELPNLCRGRKF